jgi:hypothetical protein
MTTLEIASYLAAACLALTRMAPRLEILWAKVPPRLRWLPPVVLAALPELAAALGQVKEKADWGRFGMIALALFLPGARSAAHVQLAKDAPPPTPKTGAGATPLLPLLLLAGSLAFPVALPSCSSAQLPTTSQVLSARDKTELAVTLAGQALPMVEAEVSRLIAAGTIQPDQADKARAGLAQAAHVLSVAEAWLAGEADAPGREEVLQALDGAELAVTIARAAGGKLPALTDRALELAREVVGK